MEFDKYNLSPQILKALELLKFERPTDIQARTWPLALKGRDIIGLSQAGTGKTLAFGIPMMEAINDLSGIQALVLAPTRELATQIRKDLGPFSFSGKRNLGLLIGGQPYHKQRSQIILHPNVIIGTPGRVRDFQRQEEIDLKKIKVLVLDEVDRMLDMGFQKEVNDILSGINSDCQVLLFSATFGSNVEELALRITKNPVKFTVGNIKENVPAVNHDIMEIESNWKPYLLHHLLKNKKPNERWIVFLRSSDRVIAMQKILNAFKFTDFAIMYGGLTSGKRRKTMEAFHKKNFSILLSTDITSRGIHIEGLEQVINIELPDDPENFIHRLGRTGRAGKHGNALTLLSKDELPRWQKILHKSKLKYNIISPPQIPFEEQIIDTLWKDTQRISNSVSESKNVKVFTNSIKRPGKVSGKKIAKKSNRKPEVKAKRRNKNKR